MRWTSVLLLAASLLLWNAPTHAATFWGEDLVEVKLLLPRNEPYLRGDTDLVAELFVEVTLVNRTQRENRGRESLMVDVVQPLTPQELNELRRMTPRERSALLDRKRSTRNIEVTPVNKNSLGVSYVAPDLEVPGSIEFIITRMPDGEQDPDAAPRLVERDPKPDQVTRQDVTPNRYLAAGETSPPYRLPVGSHYLIREPGWYSIRAIVPLGDSSQTNKYAESNEEKFQVLPFKVVPAKVEDVQENFLVYERGMPSFDYMFYQVRSSAGPDDVYYVQRIPVRGSVRWEWQRVCSVKPGSEVQVAQLNPKKVALYANHAKGGAGLYVLDFSTIGPAVESTPYEFREGAILRVEGDRPIIE